MAVVRTLLVSWREKKKGTAKAVPSSLIDLRTYPPLGPLWQS
jgi:hypothetical protein